MTEYEKLVYELTILETLSFMLDREEGLRDEKYLPLDRAKVPDEMKLETIRKFDVRVAEIEQELSKYQLVRKDDAQQAKKTGKAQRKAAAKPATAKPAKVGRAVKDRATRSKGRAARK